MFLFEVALDGHSLSAIAPEILLLDVIERPVQEDKQTAARALHPGLRLAHRLRQSLSVELVIMIRERNVRRRAEVMRAVTEWAWGGGWMTVNTHPGERLRVAADEPPATGSAAAWTDKITITLTAYERPYWEADEATETTITNAGTLRFPGGAVDSVVEVTATNTGADALTTITFGCGGTTITLEGLSVPVGESVAIAYTDDDIMTITAAGESSLNSRTAESDDDLRAVPNEDNAVSVSADQSVSATFYARGRWL